MYFLGTELMRFQCIYIMLLKINHDTCIVKYTLTHWIVDMSDISQSTYSCPQVSSFYLLNNSIRLLSFCLVSVK